MSKGITVRVLGDYGPFSRIGKSIGYEITIGDSIFLLDCGAPLFQLIGGHDLKKIKGLIVTHCHDDHKRWLTDLSLFCMYAPDVTEKISLFASEDILDELRTSSMPALNRSLSMDSKRIVDIPFNDYVNAGIIGPYAKYRIAEKNEGIGRKKLLILDRQGNELGPDRAKIIINPKTGRPRMLFNDPQYGEWIEPESFYPFSSSVFYEEERNSICSAPEGFTIEATKAPQWHGVPVIGIRIRTDNEILAFSSDTVNDKELWKKLYKEKRKQSFDIPEKEFQSSGLIYGDINNYIERIWSEERYEQAIKAFEDAVVIHDISTRGSTVHTDYRRLSHTTIRKESALLTHSPDRIASEWALCDIDKTFRIIGDRFFEVVGENLYPMNADIYYKNAGRYSVGYKNAEGRYHVYEKDGLLSISSDKSSKYGDFLYRVDLYEDISGKYFPVLQDQNMKYVERDDGKVELIRISDEGSLGKVIEDMRDKLAKGQTSL